MPRERLPQYLSEPLQVLFFDQDEVGVAFIILALCLVFGGLFWWTMLLVVPFVYRKAKKKYPKSFLRHCLYVIGLMPLEYYPGFFEDQFRE